MSILLTRPTLARRDAPCPRQGRSERRGESYFVLYVEPLSVARMPLADFFSILLVELYRWRCRAGCMHRQGASGSPCLRARGVFS